MDLHLLAPIRPLVRQLLRIPAEGYRRVQNSPPLLLPSLIGSPNRLPPGRLFGCRRQAAAGSNVSL